MSKKTGRGRGREFVNFNVPPAGAEYNAPEEDQQFDLGQTYQPKNKRQGRPSGYLEQVDHLLREQNNRRDQLSQQDQSKVKPVRNQEEIPQIPRGYVECPPGFATPVGAAVIRRGDKVYFQLRPDGYVDPMYGIPTAKNEYIDGLMFVPSTPYRVEVQGDGQNVGDVTAVTGFPRGHPCYEEGVLPCWEDADGDPKNRDGYRNPNQQLYRRLAQVGTSKVRKFTGGSAVQLCYFINEFAEEMNALYVPFAQRGLTLRRYLADAAYRKIVPPLDRLGKGHDYMSLVNQLFSIYHPPRAMKLAAHKLQNAKQNGMSVHDYAEWIKYLAMLAIPPNVGATQQQQRDELEVRTFVRTLDSREERLYLSKEHFPNIDAAVNALEEYYLICEGASASTPEKRMSEMSNAVKINAIAPSPHDWRLKGAEATQEDMIAYLKWKRAQGRDEISLTPLPYEAGIETLNVTSRYGVQSNNNSSNAGKLDAVSGDKGDSEQSNKKFNSGNKKKKKQNKNNQSDTSGNTSGSNKGVTMEEMTKTFQTMLNTFMKQVQSTGQFHGRNRDQTPHKPCDSTCWRCHKKGHISRNCPQPAPSGIMCVVKPEIECSPGCRHDCMCGTCHWSENDSVQTENREGGLP